MSIEFMDGFERMSMKEIIKRRIAQGIQDAEDYANRGQFIDWEDVDGYKKS